MLRSSGNSPASNRGDESLSIGAVAERTGLAVSAIRFYEDQGLITAERSPSGHRRFRRSVIRRLSFIRICQKLGYSLEEIQAQLDQLPQGRTPTEADWSAMAESFRTEIDQRIAGLEQLRDSVGSCIGCGCLSLERCAIWNADDEAAQHGPGARWLLGNRPQRRDTLGT
jgi:MerR family redox-sensitive transcriptional activator SoxR